jgi:mannosyltransferase OCH1-like enzyme
MIPRTAHMVWLGEPMPQHLAELTATFTDHHPHWDLRWWHEAELAALPMSATSRDLYDRAEEFVTADSVAQMRSDIARYEILRHHGGLYVDVDFRWQGCIDQYLEGRQLVTSWEAQGRWVATGMIASAPRHRAFVEVLADIPRRVETRHPSWRSNRLTGPHPWTPVARRHAHILPQALLHPVPWDRPEDADLPHPDSVAVHVWNHQRDLRGLWGAGKEAAA